jgi:hypothetical protein
MANPERLKSPVDTNLVRMVLMEMDYPANVTPERVDGLMDNIRGIKHAVEEIQNRLSLPNEARYDLATIIFADHPAIQPKIQQEEK